MFTLLVTLWRVLETQAQQESQRHKKNVLKKSQSHWQVIVYILCINTHFIAQYFLVIPSHVLLLPSRKKRTKKICEDKMKIKYEAFLFLSLFLCVCSS